MRLKFLHAQNPKAEFNFGRADMARAFQKLPVPSILAGLGFIAIRGIDLAIR